MQGYRVYIWEYAGGSGHRTKTYVSGNYPVDLETARILEREYTGKGYDTVIEYA